MLLALGLLLCLGVQGCATRPTSDNVAKFASSLDTVTTGVRDAYARTAQVERRAALADIAQGYVGREKNPIQLAPKVIFTGEEIKPVEDYLDLLAAYAQQLAYLAGNEPVDKVDKATKDLATAVTAFTAQNFPTLDQATVQRGVAGGQAIANFLVEEKLNRDLPPLVDRMQPQVEAVADLLNAQVGHLREIADVRVDEIGKAEAVLLGEFRDDRNVSSVQRLDLLDKALARQDELAKTGQFLAAVQDALPPMVRAHAALRSPNSAGAAAAIDSFQSYARRLLAVYQAFQKQ